MKKEVKTLHKIPADLRKVLAAVPEMKEAWDSLTPLARNEWICWITYYKKPETRKEHLKRAREEIVEGQRRPCCWPGCPHRRPSAKKWL
jgi:uncharacterized protein YdeI (YjbR/CyaY-like superfamily)